MSFLVTSTTQLNQQNYFTQIFKSIQDSKATKCTTKHSKTSLCLNNYAFYNQI